MSTGDVRRVVTGAALVAALVAAPWLVASGGQAEERTSAQCTRSHLVSEQRAELVTGSGPRVAVIGDSYSEGYGLDDPSRSWPRWLEGRVTVDGFGGSGFTDASRCPGVTYAERVRAALATRPTLLVVQGGLNDADAPASAVRGGLRAVLDQIGDAAHVVVVGPPSVPALDGEASVDRVLAAETRAAGVRYVSTLAWRLPYFDGVHLTPRGHRMFGERVAEAVAQ